MFRNRGRSQVNKLTVALGLGKHVYMPRKARIDAPGALHHVIGRGIARRKIFADDEDRENFFERLGSGIALLYKKVPSREKDLTGGGLAHRYNGEEGC